MDVDASYAKSRISSFFPREWPQTPESDIKITHIAEGFCNSVHIVSRSTAADHEPQSVILRHCGGNAFDVKAWATKNAEVEEIIIAQHMSDAGLGPRLYGVFAGGRVEEFVEGKTLVAQDLLDPFLNQQVARSLARVHALTPPLHQRKTDLFMRETRVATDEARQAMVDGFTDVRPDLLPQLHDVLDWDLLSEKEWLTSVIERRNMRHSFMLFDLNLLNILVRDAPNGKLKAHIKTLDSNNNNESIDKQSEHESVVVHVDYDFSSYGYAAMDIGGHLLMRTLNLKNKGGDLRSGLPFASMSDIRQFVQMYVQMSAIAFRESAFADQHLILAEVNLITCFAPWKQTYFQLKQLVLAKA